jgi:hypothetical protein
MNPVFHLDNLNKSSYAIFMALHYNAVTYIERQIVLNHLPFWVIVEKWRTLWGLADNTTYEICIDCYTLMDILNYANSSISYCISSSKSAYGSCPQDRM